MSVKNRTYLENKKEFLMSQMYEVQSAINFLDENLEGIDESEVYIWLEEKNRLEYTKDELVRSLGEVSTQLEKLGRG